MFWNYSFNLKNVKYLLEMRVGIWNSCGACCFLIDKGIEVFGLGEKMSGLVRFKVYVIWKWFGGD